MSKERKEMIKLKDEAYIFSLIALGQFRLGLRILPKNFDIASTLPTFQKIKRLTYLCWYSIVLSPIFF